MIFQCTECGERFESRLSLPDEPCPFCGADEAEMFKVVDFEKDEPEDEKDPG